MKHFAVLPLNASLPAALGGILQVASPLSGTISRVVVLIGTPNESGEAILDVNVNGTTIFTDQEMRPTIAEGGTGIFANGMTAEDSEVSEGDIITVDADTVPTGGFPAQSLTVLITIDDGLVLPIFSAEALTNRQVYAFDPLSGALAPADAVLTHDAVILDLYYGALARVPTTLELAAARGDLLDGMEAGSAALLLAIRTLGHTLFTSAEYIARARTDAQFVHDLYFAYLGRDSDGAGQSAWEAVLTGGATRSDVDDDFSAGTELSAIRFPRVAGAGASPRGANPMTTAGDIIVGGSGGAETRVGMPAANKVWGTDAGGLLGYKDDPASGGAVAPFDATHPDAHPASPNDADDEFDGAGLDTTGTRRSGATPWTLVNQGSVLVSQGQSHLLVKRTAANGANNVTSIVQTLPAQVFKYRCKLSLNYTNADCMAGMLLRDSVSGKIMMFNLYSSNDMTFKVTTYSSNTTVVGNIASLFASVPEVYLEIEQDATTRYFRYSWSGIEGSFLTVLSHTISGSYITAPNQIGVAVNPFGGPLTALYDWFRRIS